MPIVLFRNDFRIADNPALFHACATGEGIIPIYIWDIERDSSWEMGAASRWWLHHSLNALEGEFTEKKIPFYIFKGNTEKIIRELAAQTGSTQIFCNTRCEPAERKADQLLATRFAKRGCHVHFYHASTLFEPGSIVNPKGGIYQVFTPFWKACLRGEKPRAPLPKPKGMSAPKKHLKSESLKALGLLPRIPWDKKFYSIWHPGENGAKTLLQKFIREGLHAYAKQREYPALDGVSHLSPHIHFGEISPSEIWSAVSKERDSQGKEVFLRELGWREFAYHLLYAFPNTPDHALKEKFEDFPWKKNARWLKAWQRGKTGYPIVDAAMRQLWATGWMHNRCRMIVGSFLVKDLMIPWQEGSRWFWDTLLDADLANNTLGWQWVGGCGADAAPYFRIFNPILQGEKFDPDGDYVRQYVPELRKLPKEWIHKPWLTPSEILEDAGVELGENYPYPIINHEEARGKALKLYRQWARKTA